MVGSKIVEKFKKSGEYFDKLCNNYVEGFGVFRKYMAKHHPNLDFSTFDMEAVEKENLADCPSIDATDDNATDIMDDATTRVLVDLYPSNPT